MTEPMTFRAGAGGYELRRADELVGRVVAPAVGAPARAEIGPSSWELTIEGEREVMAATWQVIARDETGAEAAVYYHGSMRGGRVRIGDRMASLRRELGLGTEWRLRVRPDAALTLRPSSGPAGMQIDLTFVAGSAAVPELLLVLVCWSVMTEEAIGPARLGG